MINCKQCAVRNDCEVRNDDDFGPCPSFKHEARYRILDLDNTIANDSWRIPRINWQLSGDRRYHDYHSLAPFDQLGNAHLLQAEEQILIFTARPVTYRAATEEWLKRNGVQFKHLLMRNKDDVRHSVELKSAQLFWLAEYNVGLSQITSAFDDRQDVVDMYRRAGINAQCIRIHDVCAYTHPTK